LTTDRAIDEVGRISSRNGAESSRALPRTMVSQIALPVVERRCAQLTIELLERDGIGHVDQRSGASPNA
jgi:hypothetical protein